MDDGHQNAAEDVSFLSSVVLWHGNEGRQCLRKKLNMKIKN